MKHSTRLMLFLLFVISAATVVAGVIARIKHSPVANILLAAGMLAELICLAIVVGITLWGRKAAP